MVTDFVRIELIQKKNLVVIYVRPNFCAVKKTNQNHITLRFHCHHKSWGRTCASNHPCHGHTLLVVPSIHSTLQLGELPSSRSIHAHDKPKLYYPVTAWLPSCLINLIPHRNLKRKEKRKYS